MTLKKKEARLKDLKLIDDHSLYRTYYLFRILMQNLLKKIDV